MNHPPLTASHAAFVGRWLLVCIGACFLGAQTIHFGYTPFFTPQITPLAIMICLLAGLFFRLRPLGYEPVRTYQGCLIIPVAAFALGVIILLGLGDMGGLSERSTWVVNIGYALLWGALLGICQLVTMPISQQIKVGWPLCTAAAAVLGLGALYLLAPNTMIMGPTLDRSINTNPSHSRWSDFVPLACAFGGFFGLASGLALIWLLPEQTKRNRQGYWQQGIPGIVLLCCACLWARTADTPLFAATRPDDFSITYHITGYPEKQITLSRQECSYTEAYLYRRDTSPEPIELHCTLSEGELDQLFMAAKNQQIDRLPALHIRLFGGFEQTWEHVSFSMEKHQYKIEHELHPLKAPYSMEEGEDSFNPDQRQRWDSLIGLILELSQKKMPGIHITR